MFRYVNETDGYDRENTVSDQTLEKMSAQLLTMVSTVYQTKMSLASRMIVKGLAREQLKTIESTMRTAKNSGSLDARQKAEEKGIVHLLDNPLLCRPDKKEDPVMFLLSLMKPIILKQLGGKSVVITAQSDTITSISTETANTGCKR